MKIAICDDDKNELFRILSVLADYQTQRNIEFSYKPFDNSTELASNLLQEHYDIYLLDVVMPGLNGIELAKEIRSISYYNYYSNKKWGDPKSYDMCINSSAVGQEGAVDIIMELAKKKQEWKKQK